ncbi:hypothetical protein D6855_12570 [Butyrivibrio sp. CB08]|uniref:polysaccharide deacetylase WbmS family protein n=1 Tax=Butyrivibrio sp. CB08 TaxID=2364879 RepID=UPI000EA92C05|nr:hypothetical protein [Butyrivibrio sp. CB08]RKM57877.1 hypothetical protein D6855_12570 [Butyrivibrio sp. CB08]
MEWKNNAPYVLCLSHDVDRITKQWYHYIYYGLKHPMIQFKSLVLKMKGIEPYWNFEKIIRLEKSYGAVSTFFFLNESRRELSANFLGRYKITSKRVVEIIKMLDEQGFEIGLHGSFDSYNDLELLSKEKKVLEEILDHQVVSTRQHHLNFDKDKTWEYHKKIGIKYDSTIGYSNKVGNEPYKRTKENIIEIPITVMDTVELNQNVYEDCCRTADNGGIVMLNFHQCHFNELEYPENVDFYLKMLEKAKKDGAWITCVKDIGGWIDEQI